MAANDYDDVRQQLTPAFRSGDSLPAGDIIIETPALIGAIANTAATLYIGYKVGEKIENIAAGIVRVLDAIASVLNAVANIVGKLDQILEEIKHAVELINQHTDESFMRMHFNTMRSALIQTTTLVKNLQRLPKDPADARVRHLLEQLGNQKAELFKSIVVFSGQETPDPTQATIIACVPAIALWTHSFALLEKYYSQGNLRMPVWDSGEHEFFADLFKQYFTAVENNRPRMQRELLDEYMVPTFQRACKYNAVTDRFMSAGGVPVTPHEPDLYALIVDNLGGLLVSVQETTTNPTAPPRYTWKPVATSAPVHKSYEAKALVAGKYDEYLALTENNADIRAKFEDAIKRPISW